MSELMPRDLVTDLWEEILKRHWSFLETEESIDKIKERNKLEDSLQKYLCSVPNHQKFLLEETALVLRKSVCEMKDFSAHKAMTGFEAVSRYANNLFVQPWRKEFKCIKTYSGFYMHEVKANLRDAEKLLEAMGYRRVSNEIFLLEGPICADQVTNVSRDAMAAYVECQILRNIYAGITAKGLSCSWQDVYSYRERHIGGVTLCIEGMVNEMENRQKRKLQLQQNMAHLSAKTLPSSATCANCQQCQLALYESKLENVQAEYNYLANNINNNAMCALHPSNVYATTPPNLLYNGFNKMHASYPLAHSCYQHGCVAAAPAVTHHQMAHSRSLEHYNERTQPQLPHRHSFDHQPQGCMAHGHSALCTAGLNAPHLYESPYDCIDGSDSLGDESTVSYAAVEGAAGVVPSCAYGHPYNVSGNRVPLPYNISNQLNSHYAAPINAVVTCNEANEAKNLLLAQQQQHQLDYLSAKEKCSHHQELHEQQPPRHYHAINTGKEFLAHRQSSFPPDQLIDFDDRAPLTDYDYHAKLQTRSQNSSFDCDREQERAERLLMRRRARGYATHPTVVANMEHLMLNSEAYNQSKDEAETETYARTKPKMKGTIISLRVQTKDAGLTENCDARTGKEALDNNRQNNADTLKNEGKKYVTDFNYDAGGILDDFVNIGKSEQAAAVSLNRSPTQASKDRDGYGSFESWHYVYKNLDRSGASSKEQKEFEDLLKLDAIIEDTSGANGGADGKSSKTNEKRRTGQKSDIVAAAFAGKQEKSILKPSSVNSFVGDTTKKIKSALKSTSATVRASNGNHNNNNNTTSNAESQQRATSASRANGGAISKNTAATMAAESVGENKRAVKPPPVATQVIVTSPNEWSCRFCTFLNPNSKRICEMCHKTKDFNLEAASKTATCV